MSAYSVGNKHRHLPEIEQVLTDACGPAVEAIFTPHLVPMDRGIIATMYGKLKKSATDAQLIAAAREFYAGKPFMRVVDHLPTTKDSASPITATSPSARPAVRRSSFRASTTSSKGPRVWRSRISI